ncbi:MAG: LuxR C-terminal-related transcriptional regulator [Methanocellales archaeon]|nr:LuxR C-terminal-related transcriptional regulator [Methanocellales archaeon]
MPLRKTLDEKSESTKSNYIQYFGARENEILRKVLAGATNKAIAEEMGLTENRVSFIVTSPLFQEKQTSAQKMINKKFQNELATDPVKRKFHEHREEAADVIINNMRHTNAKINMEAANDVLGYDGYTKKPAEDHSTKIFIDADMSKDIYVAVKELKIDTDLLKELTVALDVEGDVTDIGTASGDKPEDISGNGEKELLDILQGDNEEQLADKGSPPSPM